jgi:hypothetical protein
LLHSTLSKALEKRALEDIDSNPGACEKRCKLRASVRARTSPQLSVYCIIEPSLFLLDLDDAPPMVAMSRPPGDRLHLLWRLLSALSLLFGLNPADASGCVPAGSGVVGAPLCGKPRIARTFASSPSYLISHFAPE